MYFNMCELQLGPCLPHKLPQSDCFSYASVLSVLQSGCGPSHLPQDLSTCCSLCLKFHSLLPHPRQIPLFNASPLFRSPFCELSSILIRQNILRGAVTWPQSQNISLYRIISNVSKKYYLNFDWNCIIPICEIYNFTIVSLSIMP